MPDEGELYELVRCIDDKKKWAKKCKELNVDCWEDEIWGKIADNFGKKVDNAYEWFLDHYPALANHLTRFKEKAEIRADKGDFWWELRPCDYYGYFDMPKIVYPEIAKESRFAFDDTGVYPLKTIFTIPSNDSFLLAILNSKLSFEYLKNICSVLGDVDNKGRLLQQLIYVEKLPIPIISFTTPEKERKERVKEAIRLYQKEIKSIAINADKWQNKEKVDKDEKSRDKKGSAKSRKVAGRPLRYKLPEEGISGEGSRLGGKVHGIREGAGEYGSSEGTPGEGKDSTRPLDSTRYFETAQGIKTYSEVSEILAVSVAKAIEAIIERTPEEINVTPEWICKLHGDIASSLFPDWAGRFRAVNVVVGTHTPPPYFEVPIHVRRYCDNLAARLSFAARERNIETFTETLAFADWRFQWIHPFRDFNGRVGRILLSAVLFKLKLPPADTASVEPEKEEIYLKALRDADGGDMSLLTTIWIDRLSKAFYEKR
jgi:fido (protein-threonine AMPylation protein)